VTRAARLTRDTWRALNAEQRVAGIAAVLLIVSTFGPFSFVEAAIALTGLGVLALLRARAAGRRFHLPFGDGSAVLAAALWSALLILTRIFDRPFGLSVLALACAAILAAAGLRERSKRPADDVAPPEPPTVILDDRDGRAEDATRRLREDAELDDDRTRRL
jgi:hypothetical protein